MEKKQEKGEYVEALENRPSLYPDLAGVWEAYTVLSHTRGSGAGGPDAIRPSDLRAHLELMGLTRESLVDYYELIIGLDVEFLKIQAAEREDAKKRSEKDANTRPNRRR